MESFNMKTSDSIAEISSALTKAWGTINNPKHNQKVKVRMKNGGQYEFEYTDLGGIIDEIKPHFKEHGISVMQHAYTEFIENRPFISVVTKLLHSSGEWIETRPLQIPASNSIQDMGGQITDMKRYSLSAILGITTEEDDDANAVSGNQVEYPSKQDNLITREQVGILKTKALEFGKLRNVRQDEVYKALKITDVTKLSTQQATRHIKNLETWIKGAKDEAKSSTKAQTS